jgi:hypothetical protein
MTGATAPATCDIRRDPPGLVFRQQLGRRSPAGFFLEIDIRKLLPVAVPHDEADSSALS